MDWINEFRRTLYGSQDGQTAIEYALVVAMVSVVVVGGLFAMVDTALAEVIEAGLVRLGDALP